MLLGKKGRGVFFGGDRRDSVDCLNSRQDFSIILERERARADRNGHGFSLVTFDLDGRNPHYAGHLKQVLADRLRLTDELGWYDDRRIGVLLFNTPRQGAWNYANRIKDTLAPTAPAPEFSVFTYPANWPAAAHDDETAPPAEPLLSFHQSPPAGVDPYRLNPLPWWKRAVDLALAPVALLAMLPLLVLFALAIKLTSRGPAFFKQERAGIRGKPFICWKFRTMVDGAEKQKPELMQFNERSGGVAFKMKNDPRVTRVGRFLRKTSLDELPQLINVLRGEMSLVGPRPLPVEEAMQQDSWHNMRLEVAPGITCLWQISARHQSSFDTWARLDIEYVRNRSFLLDLKILVLTIPAVLSTRGAH